MMNRLTAVISEWDCGIQLIASLTNLGCSGRPIRTANALADIVVVLVIVVLLF